MPKASTNIKSGRQCKNEKEDKVREHSWFIEAYGETNESLAEFLSSEGQGHTSAEEITDNLGKRRHVWRVPYRIITVLKKSMSSFPFKFNVLVQEGNGKPREFKLYKKTRKSARVKKVRDDIEKSKSKK